MPHTSPTTATKQKPKSWKLRVDLYIFFLISFSAIFLGSGAGVGVVVGIKPRVSSYQAGTLPLSQVPRILHSYVIHMSGQTAHLERCGIGSWVNQVALIITEIRQQDQLWFGKVVMWAFIVLSGGHDHSEHGVLSYVTLSVRCHLALGEHLEMKLF